MIVKNEEQLLARCLESVKDVVDEIIIVDTGSDDGTLAIAATYQASIIQHNWQNNFALARNVGLEHATGEWILVLDADEELESQTRAEIRSVIANTDADGIQMRVRSFMPAGDLQKYDDVHITRLFRNRPEFRYEQVIHEQIQPAIKHNGGTVLGTELTILHYGYARRTVQGRDSRAIRNLKLLENALAASPNDPYLQFQIGVTHKSLGNQELAYASLRKVLDMDYQTLSNAVLDKLYMKLAQSALAKNEYSSAVEYAKASLARNPNNVISLYVISLTYMFQGNIEEAYRYFRRIRQSPNAGMANGDALNVVLNYCRNVLGDMAMGH
jgi:glycosyltransferase involved in cell wall biosynthesis